MMINAYRSTAPASPLPVHGVRDDGGKETVGCIFIIQGKFKKTIICLH